MSILGRIVRLDAKEVGTTAATAVASLLPSSGFWPASPNVSHCSNCLDFSFMREIKKKKKIKFMKMREEKQHNKRLVWILWRDI